MGFKIKAMTIDEDCQFLKLTTQNGVILHEGDDVQTIMTLGEPTINTVFIGGEFDTTTFSDFRLVGYLMKNNSSVLSAASCSFSIFRVDQPNWIETPLYTAAGVLQLNNYWYVSIPETTLGVILDGDPTLMVEATIVSFGKTYKNRVYLNQIGIFDS